MIQIIKGVIVFTILFLSVFCYSQNKYPLDSDYLKSDELEHFIKTYSESYPDLFHWEIIGYSSNEKLPIYAIKISDNTKVNEPEEISLLVVGQHQSEEPLGIEIVIDYIQFLINNYNKKDVQSCVNKIEWWFVPTVNPEGDKIFRSGKHKLKRKNNTDTNLNGVFDVNLDGVDLNKNYPINWDFDPNLDQNSPYFKGIKPASESETRIMMEFYQREQFQAAIFYHSSFTGNYSEKIFYPWNWHEEKSYDYKNMKYIAKILSYNLPKIFSSSFYEVFEGTTTKKGFARDYIYSQFGTYAFTIENGGVNQNGESVVFPENIIREKIVSNNIEMLQTFGLLMIDHFKKFRLLNHDMNSLTNYPIKLLNNTKQYPKNSSNNNGYISLFYKDFQKNKTIESDDQIIIINKTEKQKVISTKQRNAIYNHDIFNNKSLIIYPSTFQQSFISSNLNGNFNVYLKIPGLSEFKLDYDKSCGYLLPWLETDYVFDGFYEISLRDDKGNLLYLPISDQVIVLNEEIEKLSYVNNISNKNKHMISPNSRIAVDFISENWGEIPYMIVNTEINLEKTKILQEYQLEIVDLETDSLLYSSKHFTSTKKNKIDVPIPFLDMVIKLRVSLRNLSGAPLTIFREQNSFKNQPSGQNRIYYSSWQTDNGNDFGISLKMQRKYKLN